MILGLAFMLSLSACSTEAASSIDSSPKSTCIDPPELTAAVETFWKAKLSNADDVVYGVQGGQRTDLLPRLEKSDLAAISNPIGAGVIVSFVYGTGMAGARETGHRTGWLVLNNKLYPINVEAAAAFGLVWAGFPEPVKLAAGLKESYLEFKTFGISELVAFNSDELQLVYQFSNEANALCEPPTYWG